MEVYLDNYIKDKTISLSGEMSAKDLKERINYAEKLLGISVKKVVIVFGIDGACLETNDTLYGIRVENVEIDLAGIKNKWMKVKGQKRLVSFVENEKYFVTLNFE